MSWNGQSAADYAPTAYVPSWIATGTNPTLNNGVIGGWWTLETPKWIRGRITLLIGSTTNVGSGNYTFGLPVAPSANVATWDALGDCSITDANGGAAAHWGLTTVYTGSSTISAIGYGTRLTESIPVAALQVNDRITFDFGYPID